MRKIGKIILFAALVGVFYGIWFLGKKGDISFSEIIITYAFDYYQFSYTDIVYITTRMLPYFLFIFLYGTYIYRHFCVAGVYVFSRCEKRLKWITKEIIKLFSFCLIFVSIIPVSGIGMACITNNITFSKADIVLYMYYVAIFSLWLFTCTLLANALAIRFGGMKGFSVVIIGICICIAVLSLWGDKRMLALTVEDIDIARRNAFLLKFNPISHLFLSWHSSGEIVLNPYIDIHAIDFTLINSVVVMTIVSAITTVVSVIYVKKVDLIIILGREEN